MNKYVICILLLLGGFLVGRYTSPSSVTEKTHTETDTKQTQVDDKTIDKNVNKDYKKTVVKNKDGSETITTEVIDKSNTTITDNNSTTTSSNTISNTEKTTTYSVNNYMLSVAADVNSGGITYGALVQKRLLGPIYLGVMGFTDKRVGLTLGVSF